MSKKTRQGGLKDPVLKGNQGGNMNHTMTFSSEELQLLVDAIQILNPDDPAMVALKYHLYCRLLCRQESER